MTTDSSPISKLAISLVLSCLVGSLALFSTDFSLPFGKTGTVDFVQYWASWQAMLNGQDCYDGHAIYAIQSQLTTEPPPLMVSWNPPWTFVLLSPFLGLPFEQSAALWFLIEILLLCLIVSIVPHAFALPQLRPVAAALVVATFFPALNSMYWGQIGILLTASLASFLFFQDRRMPFWSGIALLPLTAKPHLFLLFIPPAIKWIAQASRRDLARFLLGSLGGFSILAVVTLLIAPTSIASWLHHLSPSSVGEVEDFAVHFQNWKTATLATLVRVLISSFTHEIPTWPLVAFPVAGTVVSAVYFFRDKRLVVWAEVTPPLLCLCLMMSSYGWAYDQSLLLICHIVVISRARYYTSRRARLGLLGAAVSIQVLAFALSQYADAPQHYFAWVPPAMLLLLMADRRIRRKEILNKECHSS